MKKHLLAVGLLALIVAGAYYIQATHHHIVRKQVANFMPNEKVRQFERAEFVSVDSKGFDKSLETGFASLVKARQTNGNHIESLFPQVRRFVKSYSEGTYDSYLDFMGSGAPYELSFSGRIRTFISYSATNRHIAFSTDDQTKAREVWKYACQAGPNGVSQRITDISLERITLTVTNVTGPKTPTYPVAFKDCGTAQLGEATVIAYKDTPEQIVKKNGSITYAVVGLPCQIEHQTDFNEAHFLHLCFYWSDQYSRWLPLEMMDDHPVKTGETPFVFPESFTYPVLF